MTNILRFVQWPDGTTNAKNGPFHFCVDGNPSLGFALCHELRGTTLGERRVEVLLPQMSQEWRRCQVLFVDASGGKRFVTILESVKGANVLTIGEADGFLEAGGVLQLSSENDAVRFAVNLAAARSARLKLDARLLVLAKRVIGRREMPGN